MAGTAEKTSPDLWDKVKTTVTKGDKGGRPGQWSARKAQLAVGEYKKEGGGYRGKKTEDNHLRQWQHEDWGTKSGRKSGETGERYLPKKSRAKLSDTDYKRTTAKKRADTAKGRQFSRQPADVARKTAADRAMGGSKNRVSATRGQPAARGTGSRPRLDSLSRAELLERATARGIPGSARMRKAELVAALRA